MSEKNRPSMRTWSICVFFGQASPGGFVDVFLGEERASNHHSSGGCKVDAPLAVVVRDGMQAVWPNHRSVHLLPFNASVQIPNDDLHISLRTAVALILQLRVEYLLLAVGCFFV